MTDTQTLKPCPFCGSKPVTSTYYIECCGDDCLVSPLIDWNHHDRQEAIEAWNTRAGGEE